MQCQGYHVCLQDPIRNTVQQKIVIHPKMHTSKQEQQKYEEEKNNLPSQKQQKKLKRFFVLNKSCN
jgi:hypothetical protein